MLRAAAAGADEQAALQRTYAAADAAITPESFRAPTTAVLRSRARAAGVDLDRWLARQ